MGCLLGCSSLARTATDRAVGRVRSGLSAGGSPAQSRGSRRQRARPYHWRCLLGQSAVCTGSPVARDRLGIPSHQAGRGCPAISSRTQVKEPGLTLAGFVPTQGCRPFMLGQPSGRSVAAWAVANGPPGRGWPTRAARLWLFSGGRWMLGQAEA
jgi:hypothetical protein